MHIYDVIIRPLETEKAYLQRELDKYVFVVDEKANKLQIKRAVEEIYGATVERVNTMIMPGKYSYLRGRQASVQNAPWKKAVVTLPPGERIEALEA